MPLTSLHAVDFFSPKTRNENEHRIKKSKIMQVEQINHTYLTNKKIKYEIILINQQLILKTSVRLSFHADK